MNRTLFSVLTIVAFMLTFPLTASYSGTKEATEAEGRDDSRQVRMVEYCLTGSQETDEDRDLFEASRISNSFPLYGSREERIFRPGATIISYNGNADFKLRKAFRPRKKELSRECIFIQESESP